MAKASKRWSVKQLIAFITAFLFVLSGMPVSSITAQAVVKKPTIAKSATVKVGASKKIKIRKGSYTIVSVKVSSTKKSIATVKASGKTAIKVTGKKAGKTIITTKVKAKKGKISKTFKLKTKVTIKKASTPKIVNTQDELTAALANSKFTEITIGSEANSIKIPAGDYSDIDLIVDAPNASITNKGVFKSITIKAIAANTWHEDANGNKIYTDNEKGIRIVLEPGASVDSVKIGETTTGEVKIEVAGGSVASIEIAGKEKVDIVLSEDASVGKVKVDAAADVDITATGTSKIEKVEVTEKAAGTTTSKTVVDIKADGFASIKEITTSAANSTTNVTANGSADVAKVAVNGSAGASISGASNKVTEVDIKGADKDASVTVNTTFVKIETTAGTDTEKIINNQSGQALKTEEIQTDGTKKETTTATDATPSSDDESTTFIPQDYSITVPGTITGGSVTASKDKAAAGESVALVVVPAAGYVFDGISVFYGSGHVEVPLTPADNGYTFIVPEGDVTVSAAFRALLPVTLADIRTTTGTSIEVTRGQYGEDSYISLVTTQVNGIEYKYAKTIDAANFFGIDENGKVTFSLDAVAGTYVGKFTVTATGTGMYYTGTAERVVTVTVTVNKNALEILQDLQKNLNDTNCSNDMLTADLTIGEGDTLTVPTGAALTIRGGTLTNKGKIFNYGTITLGIDGVLTGSGEFNGDGTYPVMSLRGTVKTCNTGVFEQAVKASKVKGIALTGDMITSKKATVKRNLTLDLGVYTLTGPGDEATFGVYGKDDPVFTIKGSGIIQAERNDGVVLWAWAGDGGYTGGIDLRDTVTIKNTGSGEEAVAIGFERAANKWDPSKKQVVSLNYQSTFHVDSGVTIAVGTLARGAILVQETYIESFFAGETPGTATVDDTTRWELTDGFLTRNFKPDEVNGLSDERRIPEGKKVWVLYNGGTGKCDTVSKYTQGRVAK